MSVWPFLFGFGLGFIAGTCFGVCIGMRLGYRFGAPALCLAGCLVVIAAAFGFSGWHYWKLGTLPSPEHLMPPLKEGYASTVNESLGIAGALAGAVIMAIVAGVPMGKRQRILEEENKRLAEQMNRKRTFWEKFRDLFSR